MADNRREEQLNDIGDRIAEGISRGMEQLAPPKRIKPGSSLFDPKSPFRSKKGPRLKGTAYQNGILINDDQCYDREIELLNSITRSGRYINRIVEVILSDDAGQRVVLLRYPDKTIDQRMDNKSNWRNFKELLELIVNEQNAVVVA
jgi:hypothetical protein